MPETDDLPPRSPRRVNGAMWLAGILGVLLAVILIFVIAAFFRGESPIGQEPSFVEYSLASEVYSLKDGGEVELGYMLLVPDESLEKLTELLKGGGAAKIDAGLKQTLSQKTLEDLDRDVAVRRVLSDEIESLLTREVIDPYNATEEGKEHPLMVHDVYLYHYKLVAASG